MALGGGNFLTENKVLPGTYINFVSAANSNVTLADRGVAAAVVRMDWGRNGIIELTKESFMKNSMEYFGRGYTDKNLYFIREIFKHARKIYLYRTGASGVKASNDYATARYAGADGNKISIEILASPDKEGYFDVTTYFNGTEADRKTVNALSGLRSNEYVVFKDNFELKATAAGGVPLTGGSTISNNQEYQDALNALENYSFNALILPEEEGPLTDMYVEYTKRMRDEVGKKFQLVCYRTDADYEGVISVYNDTDYMYDEDLVFWVGGVAAGINVNASALNMKYDGEMSTDSIIHNYTQEKLEEFISKGYFVLHNVDGELRVLADINNLVSTTSTKGEVFKDNQTVRVCDQIAVDIARIFNTYYLGIMPNDKAGRLSLWNDIVKHHTKLNTLRAIEDFDEEDITVEMGETKSSVIVNDNITVVNAMGKLYMTVVIV